MQMHALGNSKIQCLGIKYLLYSMKHFEDPSTNIF